MTTPDANTPHPNPPTVVVIGCGPGGMFFLHALATKRRELEARGDVDGIAALPVVSCFERASEPGGVWRAKKASSGVTPNQSTTACKAEGGEVGARNVVSRVGGNGSGVIPDDCIRYDEEKKDDHDVFAAHEEKKDDDQVVEDEKGASLNDTVGIKSSESLDATPSSTNMYEALWTNGPSFNIEFFDYTFDDHFGHPVPVYMPRQPLLEYMLCRVTRHQPTFFQDYVTFNTTVTSVTYDEEISKFKVVTKSNLSEEVVEGLYDKCIWAAGDNGIPKIPPSTAALLQDGHFTGSVMHSSTMEDFDRDVAGKRILLVGDAYSAEDLALMAIKRGVERVYICSRKGYGAASYMGAWPMDKVEVFRKAIPTEVINEGKGIRLRNVWRLSNRTDDFCAPTGETIDLKHVDTVIFCTGYKQNVSMLDESLQVWTSANYALQATKVPSGWRMKHNPLSEEFGHIEPPTQLPSGYGNVPPGLYRGVLISNPSMMHFAQQSYYPLFELDVIAWLFLGYITGTVELPSVEEMCRRNDAQRMDEMDMPSPRSYLDNNYWKKWNTVSGDHWSCNVHDDRYKEMSTWTSDYLTRIIARDMRTGGYPDDIGSYEGLNERGRAVVEMSRMSSYDRYELKKVDEEDTLRRTFRDTCNSEMHKSIHTGTEAVPLKKRWLELDEQDEDLLFCAKK